MPHPKHCACCGAAHGELHHDEAFRGKLAKVAFSTTRGRLECQFCSVGLDEAGIGTGPGPLHLDIDRFKWEAEDERGERLLARGGLTIGDCNFHIEALRVRNCLDAKTQTVAKDEDLSYSLWHVAGAAGHLETVTIRNPATRRKVPYVIVIYPYCR